MADTPDLNQITDLTNAQKTDTQNLLAGQDAQTAAYLKKYTDFINSQEGSQAMATRIGGELGIPTLQANATMLQNTLTNLPSTYGKAMTGFDVNANQLARVIGQKSSELSPLVTTAENSLSSAQNTLNTQMGYEQTDQAKALLPYQTEQTMLNDRLARETTLYSQDNTNELNGLIAKINSGITLSEGEKNRANQLAIAEAGYQNELDKLNSTQSANASANTSIVTVGGVQKLINNATGQVISVIGKSAAPSTTTNTSGYYGTTSPSSSGTWG
jgi:hypothetical protein